MTGTELSLDIQGHIGNRTSGNVGAETVAQSVRKSINKGLRAVCKGYNPQELKYNTTIDIVDTSESYALPVLDVNAATIRIKSFYQARLVEDDATYGDPLSIVTSQVFDNLFPYYTSSNSGRPKVICKFGKALKLYPYPDDDYTIYLKVNGWPTSFTAANDGDDSPLDEEWDDTVIAWAVSDMMAKLQQPKDAVMWLNLYKQRKRETLGELKKMPSMIQSAELTDLPAHVSVNSALDPFMNRRI